MKSVLREGTRKTPGVKFTSAGELTLEGRSHPEDPKKFYSQLIDYVAHLSCSDATLEAKLEYFNTSSSRQILDMLKQLEANTKINSIKVNWHYEENDIDNLEAAQVMEESLIRTDFKYIQYNE